MPKNVASIPIPFFLLSYLLLTLWTNSAIAAIDLKNFNSGELVGSESLFLIDSEARYDLENLPEKDHENWQTSSQDIVSLGYTDDVLWLALELVNTGESTWFLEVAYPVLDRVEIYLEHPEQTQVYRLGDLKHYAERPINHRNFVIPLPALEHDQTLQIFLRVQSSTSLQVPVKLWQQTHFYNEEQSTLIWQGMYFGLIFVMTFYNLCLFYYSRETKYIYYAGVFGSFALFQATLSGFTYQFLWPASPTWNDHALPVFLGFVLISESVFVRSLLDIKKHAPKVAAFYSGSAILAAVLVIASSFIPYRIAIISLIILALPINFLGLLVGIQQWSEGNKTAQLFTIAWVGTLFGAIILALSKLGLIERNAFNENALQIGTTISVLWLSFALGEYIAQQNRERQKAKEDALEYALKISQERQEKLSAQAETLRTQKQANENLEKEVKQRTHELQKAMYDLEAANSKLKHISNIDELTGLYNRRYFNDKFELEFKRAQRMENSLSIIIIDIDYFKMVNDDYGHLVGDACIQSVAEVLKRCVARPQDSVSRFGGEEFIVLLPDTPREGAWQVATRILKSVESEKVRYEELTLNMTVSMGIAIKQPGNNKDKPESLLEKADVALYKAKNGGRNCIFESDVENV